MVLTSLLSPPLGKGLTSKNNSKTFRTRRSLEDVGFSESILSLGFSQATKYEMLFERSEFIE
jgi:hypothetical protein